jgi:hypothetical protein
MEGAGESKTDYDSEEVRAAIKIQALMRGSLRRIKVGVVLGTLIEDMLEQQRQESTDDEISETGSSDSESFENVSLASYDFVGADLKEYLEQKIDKDDPYASDDDETNSIIRPSNRKDTWITHTPTGGKKAGKWSAAFMEVSESNRGHVKERARLFDSSRNLVVEDDDDDDDDDGAESLGIGPITPISEKSDVMLGSSMNTFLSPSKFKSQSPRRTTIAFSPEEKSAKAVRRGSAAIMDKVSIFQEFADHAKETKASKEVKPTPQRRKKKKAEYDIDTCRTPTAGDLRKSFEAGLFFNSAGIPKLQPMESAESEGVKAKIAKLGIVDKQGKEHEVAPEGPKTRERAAKFATQQYIMHDSATKIQALARGFLFRQKDREATNKVLKWLKQHREIEQILTGDPEKFSEEERAQAVQELTRTINLLLPEHYMDDSDSMSSDDSGSFEEDSFEEELLEEDSEEEKLRKSHDFSDLLSSFAKANEDSRSQVPVEEFNKRGTIRFRQALMKASAIKIQAVARGHHVRKSNYGAAVKALNWLKEYKLLGDLAAKRRESYTRDFNEDTFVEAIAAINELQQQLHGSATKIQSIGRGYTVRKFDMKTMLGVVEWIRKCKIELEEAEVPEQEQLEKTWIFLENPFRWIREGDLEKTEGSSLPATADAPSEQLDVDELVGTWEYLKQKESEGKAGEKSVEDESKPGVQELAKLSKWLVQNGHPYVPSIAMSGENKNDEILLSEPQNFNDVLQLWEFLQSNGVNVDVLRGDEMDNDNKKGGYFIEYIDEDLSSVYKDPKPSIKALINYWNFTRKQEIDTILESRQTEDSAVEVSQNDTRDTSTEPAQTEDIDEVDAKSTGTDSSEEKPKPVLAKKRRTGTNIDNMMSSLKWLKKKGVNLNKVKSRTSIVARFNEEQRDANDATDQPTSISASDMKSTLAWLKEKDISPPADIGDDMSSMLAWLNEKGFDPNSKNAKGSDEGPPTITDMASALRWLQDTGSDTKKRNSLESGTPIEEPETASANENSTSQHKENPFKGILYALSWLQKKGFDLDGAAKALEEIDKNTESMNDSPEKEAVSPSVEGMMVAFGATSDGEKGRTPTAENGAVKSTDKSASKELSYQDKQSVMNWLTKRGICKTPKKVAPAPAPKLASSKRGSEKASGEKRMENALSWLEQKGFNVRKNAIEEQLAAPTPEEMAATIEMLEKHKGPSQEGRPSWQEMQEALKWVSLQDQTERKTKKKPKSKGAKKEKSKSRKKTRKSKGKTSTEVSRDNMQYALAFLQKAGKAKPDSRNLKGLEKTVDYMKQQVESQRVSFLRLKPTQKIEQAPEKKETMKMQDATGYEQSALDWLTNQGDHLADAPYFKKLNKMLPGKDSQTNEQRAKEIAKAMKWMKKQGRLGTTKEEIPPEAPSSDDEFPGTPLAPPIAVRQKIKEKAGKGWTSPGPTSPTVKDMMKKKKKEKGKDGQSSKKSSRKTATPTVKAMLSPRKSKTVKGSKKFKMGEESSPEKDFEFAVEWLNSKDENMEAANYFKKLDAMVPNNPDHTTEERARELVKALNWVRRTSEKKKMQEDAAKIAASPRKSTMKSERPIRSPKPKKTPTRESSKKKAKVKKADKEKVNRTVIGLKDLVKVQKTAKKTEKEANSPKKRDKQKTGVTESNNGSKSESTPERDYENALSFIRVKEEGGNVMDVEDANYFKKLDNMLPKNGEGDRAKEMVKMLAWLRKKGKA